MEFSFSFGTKGVSSKKHGWACCPSTQAKIILARIKQNEIGKGLPLLALILNTTIFESFVSITLYGYLLLLKIY